MKTVTIKIGADSHRLVIAKEQETARVCTDVCSLRGLCFRLCLASRSVTLCDGLLKEISDYPKSDFPFGGHFELKKKKTDNDDIAEL